MSESHYAYQGLDPLLHAPARLSIVTALYAHQTGLTFVELRDLCELSDGNLSRHLQKLEREAVVRSIKGFVGRVPRTTIEMTDAGRARFERYVDQLRVIVEHDVPAGSRIGGDTLGLRAAD